MARALETLMREHRIIERVLGSLATFTGRLDGDRPGARREVARFAEFFREFADRCHHGKEEDCLFVAMTDHGFPREAGPIAVMLAEHDTGREHVRRLTEIGSGDGPLSHEEMAAVRNHAESFIPMLAAHIQKEDRVLYPAAEQALPAAALEDLAETFERTVMGEGAHDHLHDLAEQLIETYPPNESALGSRPGGHPPCGG